MSPRSSSPNRSSGKTNPETQLSTALRTRARTAFLILLAAFQDADRRAQGALSQGRESTIFPGLVTAVLRLVVRGFAEARGISMHESFPRASTIGSAALFDPASTPFLDAALSDAVISRVRDALCAADGERIDFAQLDLEHLGTFYEGLMAFDSTEARVQYDISTPLDIRNASSDERRRLGAHYTSRVITRIVVERALAPLIATATSPEKLLHLRICDPALGSGAFLLEVCRYLAGELVRAWERTGEMQSIGPRLDLTIHARRLVAEHCLYGVDKNPRAAELARWAVFLLTASHDSAGVLLDEHVRAGDSLVGRPLAEQWFSEGLPPKREKRAAAFQRRHRPFHWDTEFPEIMARGGFDAFVGNPPWVSYAGRAAQPLADDLRAYYLETNPAFAGYRNLQGLFIARCAQMLKSSGRLGFVLPSSMSELEGYAPTRRAHEGWCECDENLPDFGDVFDEVFQPSMALLSTRRSAAIAVECPRSWPLHRADLNEAAAGLLERLLDFPKFPPELFGERGFQTMGDDVLHLHALNAPSGALCVGVRVGSDMEAFSCGSPKLYCDPMHFGTRFRPAADWQSVALLIRQTARFPIVALSDGRAFRNSILAGFSSETWSRFFLLAWLNSSPIRWYHYVRHRDARQGMPQVKIAHLRSLPAPRSRAAVARLADLGREIGERNAGISPAEQATLDALVAEALELGPADCQIVQTWATAMGLE